MRQMILALSALSTIACSAETLSASSNDNRALVEAYYSQFQKPGFEVDELLKFYADDVKFSDPTFEIIADGKPQVRALYEDIGTDRTNYTNINWNLERIVSEGDTVVISGRWSGEFHECPFDVEFATLWRLENGSIASQKDFFAASAFDRQVGWDAASGSATCAAKQDELPQ